MRRHSSALEIVRWYVVCRDACLLSLGVVRVQLGHFKVALDDVHGAYLGIDVGPCLLPSRLCQLVLGFQAPRGVIERLAACTPLVSTRRHVPENKLDMRHLGQLPRREVLRDQARHGASKMEGGACPFFEIHSDCGPRFHRDHRWIGL